jgi:hypothetical protein
MKACRTIAAVIPEHQREHVPLMHPTSMASLETLNALIPDVVHDLSDAEKASMPICACIQAIDLIPAL